MYQEMIDYVYGILGGTESTERQAASKYRFRSRFDHTMRVYNWALRINDIEKGDHEIISIAAIFHDVGKLNKGDIPHAVVGAQICEAYLKTANYPEEKIKKIVQAVSYHSSKSRKDLLLNLEDKILMDADMLDEVGALAALWDSMASVSEANPSYMKAYDRIMKSYRNLCTQKRLMKTRYGKFLYQERLDFLFSFIENLEYELMLHMKTEKAR